MKIKVTTMKKVFLQLVLLVSLVASSMAWAITLDEAKTRGLIGEKVDGYIAAVTPNASAELQALIESTNSGRRQVYMDLAKRNGITVEAVGVVSAEKLREKAAKGEYVQNATGRWERK
jgi:hypothetical protein